MIAVVATINVKEGKEAEFEAVMKELAEKVRSSEPETLHYQVCKAKDAPTYVVLENYTDQAALVKAIINMAHSLNLSVIAEGVETAEQMSFVSENSCDMVQGFYISKPLPAEKFFELASNWKGPFTRSE